MTLPAALSILDAHFQPLIWGPEAQGHGAYMVEELRRYLAGEPLRWEVTGDRAATMA